MVLDTEGLAWALSLARDWTGDLQDAMQVQVPVGEHVKENVMGSNSLWQKIIDPFWQSSLKCL